MMNEFSVRGLGKRTAWILLLPFVIPLVALGFVPGVVSFEEKALGYSYSAALTYKRAMACSVWPLWVLLAPLSWWSTGSWNKLPNTILCTKQIRGLCE